MIKNYSAIIEILFWIGIGIVFYTYLGYGIVLYLMVKIKELFVKPRLPRLPETLPEATLLIAAYNEEAIVASKMVNCRQLDYPADKLTCASCYAIRFEFEQTYINYFERETVYGENFLFSSG